LLHRQLSFFSDVPVRFKALEQLPFFAQNSG